MCIGLLNKKDLMRSDSGSPGNLLLLAGSGTGKDGIHGASGLASTTFANERELRPTVQVGNPFLEKKLIEACLEIVYSGKIDGMQDLGAAGLTSAAVECAANGGNGIEIDVSLISRRDSDMEPYEVMLSETQERMLMSVKPENLKFVINIFEKWDINSEVIGTVTDTANTVITDNGKVIADLPVYILTDPPLYTLNGIESSEVGISRNFDLSKFSLSNDTPSNIFLKILASENIASRKFIFSQYDHQVQTNTVVGPGGDAALIRIKGTNKGLASATDGNSKMCYLDPYIGSQIAVAEACRNVSCTGATPIAITNCLNFGDPEKPEIYYQLDRCVSGIADAANIFDSPVISGNVSLYNGTGQSDIYPTPIIGAVGLIDNVNKYCGAGFVNENDLVAVLGVSELSLDVKYLAGSEYLDVLHGKVMGAPEIDMDFELKLQKTCVALINDQLLNSSHDCSDGGLAITIAESAILGNKGFELSSEIDGRWDSALFGEKQSRIVISFNPKYLDQIREICNINCLPYIVIGEVLFDRFRMKDFIDINLVDLSDIWHQSLELLSQ
jgi:phosphoribosylformylglycinamidine synthase